jgi:hypothetical protein
VDGAWRVDDFQPMILPDGRVRPREGEAPREGKVPVDGFPELKLPVGNKPK